MKVPAEHQLYILPFSLKFNNVKFSNVSVLHI